MDDKLPGKVLAVRFFCSAAGNEPVRDWLKMLDQVSKKTIGEDILTVELGWPLGMPLVRKINTHPSIWEVRSNISDGRIARVLFTVVRQEMILLHGFIKKSQKTSKTDLDTAIDRCRLL